MIPEIEISASEILVARNRALEPYFHLFSVSPENVAQESLGRIMGVFSVSDRSESSAYIGNAIASVAKKEYFVNPRRGAIESFESTLHRVNLALAELVKDGQTRWMGHLNGAMAIIEKGNIHFSTTGDGTILLYRDGVLSDISDGLASEEASTHPIKTFVEISSGRLVPGDCVLLVSPELFSLFSPRELSQNAKRLIPEEKFAQFLETAMLNGLKAGAALVLSISERKPIERKNEVKRGRVPKAKPGKKSNYFSDVAFREAEQERAKAFLEEELSHATNETAENRTREESDSRSGTIYVEGEAPPEKEEHPFITDLRWKAEDLLSSIRGSVTRSIHNFRTHSFHSISDHIQSGFYSLIQATKKIFKRRISKTTRLAKTEVKPVHDSSTQNETGPIPRIDPADILSSIQTAFGKIAAPGGKILSDRNLHTERRTGIKEHGQIVPKTDIATEIKAFFHRLKPVVHVLATEITKAASFIARKTIKGVKWLFRRFSGLSKKEQLIAVCVVAFCFTLAGIAFWKGIVKNREPEPVPVIVTDIPVPVFPPEGEKNAVLAQPTAVSGVPENMVAPIFLNDSRFIATGTSIFDPTRNKTYTVPSGSPVTLASGMNDLGIIFLVTESGDVFSFSPTNGSFMKNAITMPQGLRPAGIGTFLTYLYLLDSGSGNIYRFPRADGGFGDGTLWTRETMGTSVRAITVSENIYGASSDGVVSFFRGRPADGFSLELPDSSLSVTAICANPDMPDTFAILDASGKRIVLYAKNGELLKQYYSESLTDMTACAIGKDGIQFLVSSSSRAMALTLSR